MHWRLVEERRTSPFDEAALFKAVELAKADLTTELVKEFTELQGVIGGLYARAQGWTKRLRRPSTSSTSRPRRKTRFR